ncbi:MAG: pyrroline-5-carboxylate reductase [Muribaculaceae bacterium]|nr:pyrroline-5-carboxylate reductase [Muribaculaceae bacterium]
MKEKKKFAILGSGNMGSAIAASLPTDKYDIVCTAATDKTLDRISKDLPGISVTLDNRKAVSDADIIVLAIKPYLAAEVIEEVLPEIKQGSLILSVMAGISLDDLSSLLKADEKKLNVMRVMPNTAIRLGKSVTFICHYPNAAPDAVAEAEQIFNLSGKAFIIPEKNMGACMALASCGIAYFLRFIRAAAEGSVELGLRPGFATEVAALTAEGAAALLADGSHPEVEIDKVTTPGGFTIKGLNALEQHGMTYAVIAALKASI